MRLLFQQSSPYVTLDRRLVSDVRSLSNVLLHLNCKAIAEYAHCVISTTTIYLGYIHRYAECSGSTTSIVRTLRSKDKRRRTHSAEEKFRKIKISHNITEPPEGGKKAPEIHLFHSQYCYNFINQKFAPKYILPIHLHNLFHFFQYI